MKEQQDIERLLALGRESYQNLVTDSAELLRLNESVNRQHGSFWSMVCENLEDDEIIYLYRGAVLAEASLKWNGGSVAAAIWIYNEIAKRHMDTDHLLADFGLANCDNPWVPFGQSYYGKRRVADYLIFQESKKQQREIKAQRHRQMVEMLSERKQDRLDALAELRRLTFEERGAALRDLRAKYRTSTSHEKLQVIADDPMFPPEYYPVEWIELSEQELVLLPSDVLQSLRYKLYAKTKGKWKRFVERLGG